MSRAPESPSPRRRACRVLPQLLWLVLGGALLWGGSASAQMLLDGPPPQHRLVYRNMLFARTNPSGLIDDARITYRYRLFRSESPALRDNFIGVGLVPSLSPAFARVGVVVEVQPITPIQLFGIWERVQYFGGFNFLQSFPSARSEASDTLMAQRAALPVGDPLRNYAGGGTQLTLGANLQMKVGPLVGRTSLRMVQGRYDVRAGDRVYYDIMNDVAAPNGGWVFTNDADLLYQGNPRSGLTFGLRWTVTRALYGPEHYAPGEPQSPVYGSTHRVGPLLAYTLFNEDGARFNSPTLIAGASWWLRHPYRTGREVSAAVPQFLVGMAFTGDLLPVKEQGTGR